MPPKGSGAVLRPEDFRYNEGKTKVACRVCSTGISEELLPWILPQSGPKHLESVEHGKALELLEDASRKREQLAKERLAESAAQDLHDLTFTPTSIARGPIAAVSSALGKNYAVNGAEFDAGDDTEDTLVRHEKLREEARIFGVWNPDRAARDLGLGDEDVAGQILGDDEEEDFLAEILQNANLEEPEPGQISGQPAIHADSEWFPYPSRMMFLLDTLDNLPRLRISSSLMRVFLWILKEGGCKDVPSFDNLRRTQKKLRSEVGIPSIPCKSPLGNVFFMNDPRAIVAQDWSNPTTRKLIHVYPEIPEDGIIREIWHAQKWRKTMDLDFLSPMFDAGISHYYVNEICSLKNGDLIVPIRWVKFRGKVYCDAFSVTFDDQDTATINDETTQLVCTDELSENFLNLRQAGRIPVWSESTTQAGHPTRMPNPKREIAGGDPLYTSFVDYFGDDVSGNRTKSWNKHWNAYFTHRNLPRKLLQQEFHVHFVSTSPNASISEQFREFKIAVESTHTDPSEIAGHIGGKGNHFCRKCEVGGTQKEKAENDGYHALFEPGTSRTKERILLELEKQVKLACTGVLSHVKELQTRTGVKDVYTQYWIDNLIARFKEMKQSEPDRTDDDIKAELVQWTVENKDKIYSAFLTMKGFDPTKDTPVEILHTILLGIVKYIWHISHTPATNTNGLSIHAIRANYIMQYAGSLIGRQLKAIAQTNVFHVYDILSPDKFKAWKATGELAALLWFPEIRNLAEYRADLRVAVANVLDIFAEIDPSKIISKIKYHLLTHIDDDAVGFGPLVGVATEIYECFNAIFRYCSILSNHLAPSRDIALQLGDQEGLKHRLTGGWWRCGEEANWKRAGPGVRLFLAAHPVLQKLLGWSDGKLLKFGSVKLAPLKRGQKDRDQLALKTTTAARALNFGSTMLNPLGKKCTSVVMDQGGKAIVILELFQVLSTRDETFGMPILVRRDSETIFCIFPAKDIMFNFNVQHACHTANCDATGERLRMQERVESDNTEKFIEHNALDRFIINSHAFHNAHLLRATLPRDLLAPIPLFADRRAKHDELATRFRAEKDNRAAMRKRKAAETASSNPRPRKRQKRAAPRNQSASPAPPIAAGQQVAPQVLPPPLEPGLAAGRAKRAITRSARAIAAEENAQEEDEDLLESDDSELYLNSGDEDWSE
ncbi:hypothetical protein C8F04DRAFT_1329160 [Mycena alexandri]|uniref:Uncharacterized protein n=1 Tax=Mycena alexandri TaxID=1745969 RepID=A0AAD6RZ48_9AGAR|nr:hypothetical protein C8F04DRAFT_1329160 [Mycena alexandri]